MPKQIQIKATAERQAEVLIYDVIGADFFGEGVTAKGFSEQLDSFGELDCITVRINSPGGDVFDGTAIYNALVRNKAKVVCEIDGIAASAASFIAMAGDTINIAENGMMMIHRAQGAQRGDAGEMLKMAEVLEKLDDTIAAMYAKRSGRRPETFLKAMSDETWYTAQEAKDAKLADAITPGKKAMAQFSPEILNRISKHPEKIAALAKVELSGSEIEGEVALEPKVEEVAAEVAEYIETPEESTERTAGGPTAEAVRARLVAIEAGI